MSKHHSHEISDHPEVQWALELLKPDPDYESSVAAKYGPDVACMTMGFSIPCLANHLSRRPFYSRIQMHVIAVTIGYFIAQVGKKLVSDFHAERDTRMRDYIIRHPELFPEPERIKYSQVLDAWTPMR
ncbi:hypothetical protein P5V15_010421 [Pogonomyrmex californicus]